MNLQDDDLFVLVKSLDRTEKGYFKKFAARYGAKLDGNGYLLLFDLLDKMEKYDEGKLKKQFEKAERKVNLSAQKTYLWEQIMKALRSYHSKKNFRYELLEMMQDMEIYAAKGLFDQLDKTQRQAHDICQRRNVALNLLQVNYYRQLHIIHHYEAGDSAKMEAFRTEQEMLMREYQVNLNLSRLEDKVHSFYFRYQSMCPADVKKLTAGFTDNPLFQQASKLTLRQQCTVCSILNMYYSMCGEEELSIAYLKERVALIEQIDKNPLQSGLDYIITLYNLALELLTTGDYTSMEYYQQKLEHLKTSDVTQEHYKKTTAFRLRMVILTTRFTGGGNANEVLRAEQEYLSQPLPQKYDARNAIAQQFSYLFYVTRNYDKALHWCHLAIEENEKHHDSAFISNALQKAIIHYERNELSLLESISQSAIYYIRRYHTELEEVCTAFTLLVKAGQESNDKKKNELLAQLQKLNAKGIDKDYLNVSLWCEAQLKGIAYLNLKSEKQVKVEAA